MKILRSHNQQFGLAVVLSVIALFGSAIRLFFVLRADFPLNDGGMFFQMTQEIQQNRYILPVYTAYNASQIPFAYPPLPFYFAALLQQVSGLDLLLIFRFLPVVFSILTIPAFFLLSREILGQDYPAIHATLIFAILPPGYEWLIMGGGVNRAPAFLFSLLALWLAIRALKHGDNPVGRRNLAWAALFAGLTVFSHLEIFLITCIWIAAAAFLLCRNRWGLVTLLLIGASSALLSAPWWLSVIFRHGPGPFLRAMQSGEFNLAVSLGDLLLRNLSEEFLFTPVLVFGMMGLVQRILKKDWLLPSWVLAVAIFDPRSLERSITIPLSMLAGLAIQEIILPGLNAVLPGSDTPDVSARRSRLLPNLISAVLVAYMLIRTAVMSQLYIFAMTHNLDVLSQDDRSAMQWVMEHTPATSRFLVLTPPTIWETNEVVEWFPVLSRRPSLSTVQGTEWLPGSHFFQQKQLYEELTNCVTEDQKCIEDIAQQSTLDFGYIYLSGKLEDRVTGTRFPLPIETALRASPTYELVYEVEGVSIFARR